MQQIELESGLANPIAIGGVGSSLRRRSESIAILQQYTSLSTLIDTGTGDERTAHRLQRRKPYYRQLALDALLKKIPSVREYNENMKTLYEELRKPQMAKLHEEELNKGDLGQWTTLFQNVQEGGVGPTVLGLNYQLIESGGMRNAFKTVVRHSYYSERASWEKLRARRMHSEDNFKAAAIHRGTMYNAKAMCARILCEAAERNGDEQAENRLKVRRQYYHALAEREIASVKAQQSFGEPGLWAAYQSHIRSAISYDHLANKAILESKLLSPPTDPNQPQFEKKRKEYNKKLKQLEDTHTEYTAQALEERLAASEVSRLAAIIHARDEARRAEAALGMQESPNSDSESTPPSPSPGASHLDDQLEKELILRQPLQRMNTRAQQRRESKS